MNEIKSGPCLKKLSEVGEFGLIKRLAERVGTQDDSVPVGIGDDAAVIKIGNGNAPLLITTDSLVEDVHFKRDHPPEALGWKALAVNISDIAAMGGAPEHYLLSLGVPPDLSLDYMDRFFSGLDSAADKYGLTLVGGDTVSSPEKIYISITVLGRTSYSPLLRKGAGPGDAVFVTGTLGDSALGLKLLEEGRVQYAPTDMETEMIDRHLRPTPRVEEGKRLAKSGLVTSMMDISDGLLADLGHICEESGVGADVRMNKIPLSAAFRELSGRHGGIDLALSGGEDYELLFTVKDWRSEYFHTIAEEIGCTMIGEIVEGNRIEVLTENGSKYSPKDRGFEHFKK